MLGSKVLFFALLVFINMKSGVFAFDEQEMSACICETVPEMSQQVIEASEQAKVAENGDEVPYYLPIKRCVQGMMMPYMAVGVAGSQLALGAAKLYGVEEDAQHSFSRAGELAGSTLYYYLMPYQWTISALLAMGGMAEGYCEMSLYKAFLSLPSRETLWNYFFAQK